MGFLGCDFTGITTFCVISGKLRERNETGDSETRSKGVVDGFRCSLQRPFSSVMAVSTLTRIMECFDFID